MGILRTIINRMKSRPDIVDVRVVKDVETESEPPKHYEFLPAPIDTSGYRQIAPTEKQLNYATDLGIEVVSGMTKSDLSAVIARVVDEDFENPSIGLLKYAQENGEAPSPYLGLADAVAIAKWHLKDPELCAFYLYCAYCSQLRMPIDNLNDSDLSEKIRAYGIEMSEDQKVVNSIRNRPSKDSVRPNKKTAAYAAAAKYIELL